MTAQFATLRKCLRDQHKRIGVFVIAIFAGHLSIQARPSNPEDGAMLRYESFMTKDYAQNAALNSIGEISKEVEDLKIANEAKRKELITEIAGFRDRLLQVQSEIKKSQSDKNLIMHMEMSNLAVMMKARYAELGIAPDENSVIFKFFKEWAREVADSKKKLGIESMSDPVASAIALVGQDKYYNLNGNGLTDAERAKLVTMMESLTKTIAGSTSGAAALASKDATDIIGALELAHGKDFVEVLNALGSGGVISQDVIDAVRGGGVSLTQGQSNAIENLKNGNSTDRSLGNAALDGLDGTAPIQLAGGAKTADELLNAKVNLEEEGQPYADLEASGMNVGADGKLALSGSSSGPTPNGTTLHTGTLRGDQKTMAAVGAPAQADTSTAEHLDSNPDGDLSSGKKTEAGRAPASEEPSKPEPIGDLGDNKSETPAAKPPVTAPVQSPISAAPSTPNQSPVSSVPNEKIINNDPKPVASNPSSSTVNNVNVNLGTQYFDKYGNSISVDPALMTAGTGYGAMEAVFDKNGSLVGEVPKEHLDSGYLPPSDIVGKIELPGMGANPQKILPVYADNQTKGPVKPLPTSEAPRPTDGPEMCNENSPLTYILNTLNSKECEQSVSTFTKVCMKDSNTAKTWDPKSSSTQKCVVCMTRGIDLKLKNQITAVPISKKIVNLFDHNTSTECRADPTSLVSRLLLEIEKAKAPSLAELPSPAPTPLSDTSGFDFPSLNIPGSLSGPSAVAGGHMQFGFKDDPSLLSPNLEPGIGSLTGHLVDPLVSMIGLREMCSTTGKGQEHVRTAAMFIDGEKSLCTPSLDRWSGKCLMKNFGDSEADKVCASCLQAVIKSHSAVTNFIRDRETKKGALQIPANFSKLKSFIQRNLEDDCQKNPETLVGSILKTDPQFVALADNLKSRLQPDARGLPLASASGAAVPSPPSAPTKAVPHANQPSTPLLAREIQTVQKPESDDVVKRALQVSTLPANCEEDFKKRMINDGKGQVESQRLASLFSQIVINSNANEIKLACKNPDRLIPRYIGFKPEEVRYCQKDRSSPAKSAGNQASTTPATLSVDPNKLGTDVTLSSRGKGSHPIQMFQAKRLTESILLSHLLFAKNPKCVSASESPFDTNLPAVKGGMLDPSQCVGIDLENPTETDKIRISAFNWWIATKIQANDLNANLRTVWERSAIMREAQKAVQLSKDSSEKNHTKDDLSYSSKLLAGVSYQIQNCPGWKDLALRGERELRAAAETCGSREAYVINRQGVEKGSSKIAQLMKENKLKPVDWGIPESFFPSEKNPDPYTDLSPYAKGMRPTNLPAIMVTSSRPALSLTDKNVDPSCAEIRNRYLHHLASVMMPAIDGVPTTLYKAWIDSNGSRVPSSDAIHEAEGSKNAAGTSSAK